MTIKMNEIKINEMDHLTSLQKPCYMGITNLIMP